MKRSLFWAALSGLALLLGACSDQAAPVDQVHPAGWVLAHGSGGGAEGPADDCKVCHGADLGGGPIGVGCRDCHLEGPPFAVHPANWGNPVIAHLGFAEDVSWTGCATAACHGADLRGGHGSGETGPSCFTSEEMGCHGGGPSAPHSMPFVDPADHGPGARNLQKYCRNCHGRPLNTFDGGFITDPDILDNTFGSCSNALCHPAAFAHPTNWQGTNDTGPGDQDPTYSSSHRRVGEEAMGVSCALCHNVTASGAGPLPGAPSCFSSGFTNADGSTTGCHADGPGSVPHDMPFVAPSDHGPLAKGDGSEGSGQAYCQLCHGEPGTTDFGGGLASTACSQAGCHPAAGAHPTHWQGNNDPTPDYLSSHQTIQDATVTESCAICHRTDGAGDGPLMGAPSCFSSRFVNSEGITSGCHAEGPGTSSHAIPFEDPNDHGTEAKADLVFCQGCHGIRGTTSFEGGFVGVACSTCHLEASAHPTNWQGSNDTDPSYFATHRNAGSLDTACAVCHNTVAEGPGPNPGAPSCFSANFTNADGSATPCHPDGPAAPHELGSAWSDPGGHGADGKQRLLRCQECHGTPGTRKFDGGFTSTSCSACHPAAGAHPTDWQGNNDASPDYLATHRTVLNWGADCALCHDTLQGESDPTNPGPSCYSSEHTNANGSLSPCHADGPGPGHLLPFLTPLSLHGSQAKLDMTYCQHCHADPFDGGPGSNPRFNVPLGGGVIRNEGCEACHRDFTAHPVPWAQGTLADHKQFGSRETVCALCHGTNLLGVDDTPAGVGRDCRDCHAFGLPIATSLEPVPLDDCTSCHNAPPDGLVPPGSDQVNGDVRPNRAGAHAVHNALPKVEAVCNSCHNGAGTDTAAHYDTAEPANIAALPAYLAKNTNAWSYAGGSCTNVSCHGGQQTLGWTSGLPQDDCTSCHRSRLVSDQYNSYYSGEHETHIREEGLTCTVCHNSTTLAANHFTNLDTQNMEGPAAETIGGGTTSIPEGKYTSGSCTPADPEACHGREDW